jgi:RNA polymerase sigma-70 factor (ECF subfamily)
MTKDLDTPEELALTEEVCDAVNVAITALSVDQDTAIVLREFEGLSYSQVAEAMFCLVGTVRLRVFRADEAIHYQLRHILDDGLGRSRRVAPAMRRSMSEVSCPV